MYEDKVGRGQLSAAYSGLGQITSIVSPMLWGQVRCRRSPRRFIGFRLWLAGDPCLTRYQAETVLAIGG